MPSLNTRMAPVVAPAQYDQGTSYSFAGTLTPGFQTLYFQGFTAQATTTLAPGSVQVYAANQDDADMKAAIIYPELERQVRAQYRWWIETLRMLSESGTPIGDTIPAGVLKARSGEVQISTPANHQMRNWATSTNTAYTGRYWDLIVASNGVDTIWTLPCVHGSGNSSVNMCYATVRNTGITNWTLVGASQLPPKTTQHNGSYTLPVATGQVLAIRPMIYKTGLQQ